MPSIRSAPHLLFRKVVVVFDICSSTAILDDLIRTENHSRWTSLLVRLERKLLAMSTDDAFEIYKFLGDGYILLFEFDHDPGKIFTVLRALGEHFKADYETSIETRLDVPPKSVRYYGGD